MPSEAHDSDDRLSIGQCATLACLLEVAAPKPGNVHRGADFADLHFNDFLLSAVAIGPIMEEAHQQPLGRTVLRAIQATRRSVGTNTNLGTVLLLAPLAKVPRDEPLAAGVGEVLATLTSDDARDVYEAIRTAQPGGLGTVERMDVAQPPPDDLLAAMRAAAEVDLVARQYAEDFNDVLRHVAPWLVEGVEAGWTLPKSVVHVQMRLLARFGDGLICRKCGVEVSQEAAARAGVVLAVGDPPSAGYAQALADFDFWLRADGHRRNPGTTADLIAAGLFVALRDRTIPLPANWSGEG